jgi:hypothetical protein
MKTSTLYLCLLFLCINVTVKAQQKDSIPTTQKDSIALKKEAEKKYLAARLKAITLDEKMLLKNEVQKINTDLELGNITAKEAEARKKKAALLSAANIEYRMAKVKRELLTDYYVQEGGTFIRIGEIFDSRIIKKRIRYDRRTFSDLVFAFGFNNAIQEGVSLNDSEYRLGGSRFFEFGILWSTRVAKNNNFVRFRYGLTLQYNSLKPTGNRYFVDNNNGLTTLEEFPNDLRRSKIRLTNLTVPLYFEFGPSKKRETKRYVRYYTNNKFKFGIGGYVGVNIAVKQKLRYSDNGDRVDQEIRRNYNTNTFVYGVGAYVGWDDMSLYCKYDLSPIFKGPNPKQRNISLGVRLDVF